MSVNPAKHNTGSLFSRLSIAHNRRANNAEARVKELERELERAHEHAMECDRTLYRETERTAETVFLLRDLLETERVISENYKGGLKHVAEDRDSLRDLLGKMRDCNQSTLHRFVEVARDAGMYSDEDGWEDEGDNEVFQKAASLLARIDAALKEGSGLSSCADSQEGETGMSGSGSSLSADIQEGEQPISQACRTGWHGRCLCAVGTCGCHCHAENKRTDCGCSHCPENASTTKGARAAGKNDEGAAAEASSIVAPTTEGIEASRAGVEKPGGELKPELHSTEPIYSREFGPGELPEKLSVQIPSKPECETCGGSGEVVDPPSKYDIAVGESRRWHRSCPDCTTEPEHDEPSFPADSETAWEQGWHKAEKRYEGRVRDLEAQLTQVTKERDEARANLEEICGCLTFVSRARNKAEAQLQDVRDAVREHQKAITDSVAPAGTYDLTLYNKVLGDQ